MRLFGVCCPRDRGVESKLSARGRRHGVNENSMKKDLLRTADDDLRPEYDLSRLKGGVRGKYHRQALAGTNLALIEPDLAKLFPDSESVNRALRMLAETAKAATATKRRRTR